MGTSPTPVTERVLAKCVIEPDGCWRFTGSSVRGYGRIFDGNGPRLAHRVMYEQMVGAVPDGLDLDHLCRNRACVNPAHLEPVTRSVNLRRSPLVGKHGLERTHCVAGHEFTEANIYRNRRGYRSCRTCYSTEMRAIRAERRALAAMLDPADTPAGE